MSSILAVFGKLEYHFFCIGWLWDGFAKSQDTGTFSVHFDLYLVDDDDDDDDAIAFY